MSRTALRSTLCAAAGLALAAALAAAPAQARPAPWKVAPLANAPGSCSARLEARDVDLVMVTDTQGKLVLIAGHHDWNDNGRDLTHLSVDGGQPITLVAYKSGGLVTVLPNDATVAALRGARRINWSLPTGLYKVEVEGLGAALDGLQTCQQALAARPATPGG
ncbi:MAG: hypothetical protein JSR86_17315 [Proteobacteria bacterium]|nr:hypothetical protein [Pseudomonadota bacterium]